MATYSKYYRKNLMGLSHDTLEVVGRMSDVTELLPDGHSEIRRQWMCRCRVCDTRHIFTPEDLLIGPKPGSFTVWTSAHCSCHRPTSFDWELMYLFRLHHVKYDAYFLVSIPYLGETIETHFTFVLYEGKSDKVKCFVDCHPKSYYLEINRHKDNPQQAAPVIDYYAKRDWCLTQGIEFIALTETASSSIESLETRLKRRKVL